MGRLLMDTTASETLAGRQILVVEDEFFIADDLKNALAGAGADVLGPVPSSEDALRILSEAAVEFAILDINLHGEVVFPIADTLIARRIPFVFATGYSRPAIPDRFSHIQHWQKPFDVSRLVASVEKAIE